MSRKLPAPKQCPRCNKTSQRFTGKICHNCYRNYIWKRKLFPCKRCKRQRPMHAKGYCNGCYNSVFRLEQTKDYNHQKHHKISPEIYNKITKKCIICNFDKFVELHHVDLNRNNRDETNLVGLCPNHHKMIHTLKYRKEITAELKQKLKERKGQKLL